MSLKFLYNKKTEQIANLNNPIHQQHFDAFKNTIESEKIGFFHINKNQNLWKSSLDIAKKFSHKKHFVHVGIGGSSLGPEMLITALSPKDSRFTFINNIDPDMIYHQLKDVDYKNSLFYFVSKSGGTAETMATLAIIGNKLIEAGITEDQWKDHMVFATDPVKSDLLNLSKELNIEALEIPSNVGGRFSVLTPVGYLPAAFAGLDLEKFVKGAEDLKSSILNPDLKSNPLVKVAAITHTLKLEKNISQTVLMPYSSVLRDLSFWFVQLWAESLGKKKSTDGKIVNEGLTPIPGYGATDQHSQVQLFMEGPFDKLFFMLEVDQFNHDYSLKNNLSVPALKRLGEHSLAKLMKAEFEGTLKALQEQERDYIHFKIDKVDEYHIAQLVLFYESLTALMGHYLNIDPFDQPGVEAGKIFAFEWLKNA